MKLRLTVTFDQEHGGEEIKLLCASKDFLAWEKAGPDRSALRMIRLDVQLTDLYSLAFAALRRQGLWSGKESELLDQAELDLGWAPDAPDEEPAPDVETEDVHPTPSDHSSGG